MSVDPTPLHKCGSRTPHGLRCELHVGHDGQHRAHLHGEPQYWIGHPPASHRGVSRTSARRLFWWVAFVLALILGVGAALVLAGSESHAASHGSYSTQVTD